jgi:peptide/nickel transport system substrate-binding protein
VPAVTAEAWDFSTDNTRIKLNLRKGVQFHSGRELTSDDIKYNLLRLRDPKNVAIARSMAGQSNWWTSIETPDKSTVVLTSDKPRPGAFDLFQYMNIVDRDVMEGQDAASKNWPGHSACTPRYSVTSSTAAMARR